MSDLLASVALALAAVALGYAIAAHRHSKAAFTIIENRNTRTVVVNTDDGKITVIKEFKNDPISTDQL